MSTRSRKRKPKAQGDGQGLIMRLADQIVEGQHFAQDEGQKLYRFNEGAYRQHGDQYVRARVKALCIEWDVAAEWTPKLANDVVEFIRVDAQQLWRAPPADSINVLNGILDLEKRVKFEHSPKWLSTVQLPVVYNPQATCPAIDLFIKQVFPADAIEVAFEIPAYAMTPWRSIQKAILATGEGSNGKSVYLRLVRRFIGRVNTTSTSLHKLESNRFSSARLLGKLANICPDLPSEHLAGTSVFKALTGGDDLPGEYKFGAEFDFRSYAVLIFSANHPPRSNDASHAFFRRWHVVPFLRTITPEEAIPDDQLDAKLHAADELSGLLNRCIEAWHKLRVRGRFLEPESCQVAWREFRASTDPFAVWLSQFTIDAADTFTPKGMLIAAYTAHCQQHGRPALSKTAFGLALRRERQHVQDALKTLSGRRVECYVGIGLLHSNGDDATSVTSVTSLPHSYHAHARAGAGEKQDSENCLHSLHSLQDDDAFDGPVDPFEEGP